MLLPRPAATTLIKIVQAALWDIFAYIPIDIKIIGQSQFRPVILCFMTSRSVNTHWDLLWINHDGGLLCYRLFALAHIFIVTMDRGLLRTSFHLLTRLTSSPLGCAQQRRRPPHNIHSFFMPLHVLNDVIIFSFPSASSRDLQSGKTGSTVFLCALGSPFSVGYCGTPWR